MGFSTKHRQGFTLVELLISVAILGGLLVALNAMFVSNTNLARQQTNSVDAEQTVRLAMLRIGELIAQAHYIYPAEQTLTLNSTTGVTTTVTTGVDTLALLVPGGSTFCSDTGQTYCGYIVNIRDRGIFESVLGDGSATEFALVEGRNSGMTWNRDAIPASALTVWSGVSLAVLADSIVPFDGTDGSDLASFNALASAKAGAVFDEPVIPPRFSNDPADRNSANGLILSVSPTIVVKQKGQKGGNIMKRGYYFSRSIPRANQPNP